MKKIILICFLITKLWSWQKNEISFGTGTAANIYTKVTIYQHPFPAQIVQSHFSTRPFSGSIYYQLRYTHWLKPSFGLGCELVHHKLYLDEKPDYIQKFQVTNGFNLLCCNQLFRLLEEKHLHVTLLLGEGIVIAHPETTIRGQRFSEHGGLRLIDTDGYFVSGLTLQTAVNIRCYLAYFEWKETYAYATLPISSGTADVVNLAFHLTSGLTLNF